MQNGKGEGGKQKIQQTPKQGLTCLVLFPLVHQAKQNKRKVVRFITGL